MKGMHQKSGCHLFTLLRILRLSQKTPFCEKCSYVDALRNVRLMRLFSNKNKRATYHRNWHDHRRNNYHPVWQTLLAAVRVFDAIVITEKSTAIGRNDQTQKSVYEPNNQQTGQISNLKKLSGRHCSYYKRRPGCRC